MKSRSSNPQLTDAKQHSLYSTGIHSISTKSLPLRHSSKPRTPVYSNFDAPASHCQIDYLALTPRHQQDLANTQYHLLYDLIGSRFYASCPDLIGRIESKEKLNSCSEATAFYQVKSRSSYRIQAPGGDPRSRVSKIAHGITTYLSACIGIPSCFREERGKHGHSDL
jgi:hypothetical protein